MDNNDIYNLIAEGEGQLPSTMGVLSATPDFDFSETYLKNVFNDSSDFEVVSFERNAEEESDFVSLAAAVTVKIWDADINFNLYVCRNEINLNEFGFANRVGEEELDLAIAAKEYLEITMYFDPESLTDSFLIQLKLLNLFVPQSSIAIDFSSLQLLSGHWLRMSAASDVPPSPDYLFTIHAVYEGEGEQQRYWLHTHGLHRCGMVEFEVLDLQNGAQDIATMMTIVVKKLLGDLIPEEETFEVGYDGTGLNLCWVRWEKALEYFESLSIGGLPDRLDENNELNIHGGPSGVLFAVENDRLISPELYVKTLQDNPIYFITNEETARMSALAIERFDLFKRLFDVHKAPSKKTSFFTSIFQKQEKSDEEWRFLVKIGVVVDDAENDSQREHLWFELISAKDTAITGVLLNQPYWIKDLNEGDINMYELSDLTDWIIYGPEGSYTADTIYELYL